MSEAGVLIPAVAPGQWRTATKPDGTQVVTATIAGGRDAVAVRAQLESWLRSLRACSEPLNGRATDSLVLLPTCVEQLDEAVVLDFPAPAKIGAEGLPPAATPNDVLEALRRVAAGLDVLHACNVIHGGLGLPSLWWMSDGSIRCADVALAHSLEDLAKAPASAASYRPPEAWRGRGLEAGSDQYALAVIAHELLSGRTRTVVQDADGITSLEPITIEPGARLYPGAPHALNDVLQRALSASPSGRYPTCTAFVEALAGHVVDVRSLPTAHRRVWRRSANASRRVMALGLVAVVSVVTAMVVLRGSVRPVRIAGRFPSSLPRLDASVLPTASADRSYGNSDAPGAPPRSAGGSGGGTGSGVLPSSGGGSAPRPSASAPSGGTSGGDRPPAPAPPSLQRGSLPNTPASRSGSVVAATGANSPRPSALPGVAASAPSSATAGSPSLLARLGSAIGGVGRAGTSTPSSTGSSASVSQASAGVIADDRASAPTPQSAPRPSGGSGSSAVVASSASRTSTRAPLNAPSRPTAVPPTPSSNSAVGTVALQVPSGSRIYVDGVLVRPTGKTMSLPVGAHDIDIVTATGVRTRRRVMVSTGETITVRP